VRSRQYAAEVVADIVSGHRVVKNTYWLGRWRKTRWLDVRDPANPKRLSSEVGLALWWLFITVPGAKGIVEESTSTSRRRIDTPFLCAPCGD